MHYCACISLYTFLKTAFDSCFDDQFYCKLRPIWTQKAEKDDLPAKRYCSLWHLRTMYYKNRTYNLLVIKDACELNWIVVLVTGASGFIGSQVVDLLLRNEYRVRGTVRCLRNEVKIRPLLNLCPDSKYPLELVEADLNDHDSWDRLVLIKWT